MIKIFIKYGENIKNTIHNNIYMIIGCYGILSIILMCCAIKWIFNLELSPIFSPLLLPAWENSGDLSHLLGTDIFGYDIFNYLLVSYKTTLTLTVRATFYVIVIGLIINYLLFFIPKLRGIVALIFRVIISIPPLLSTIVMALVWNNNINAILVIVGISYLPRFVHNIHQQIIEEWQKTYITAYRLDGLSTQKIVNFYIIPNIFPTYLAEVIVLFSHVILALTILTFLDFGHNITLPTLGTFMYQMLGIINTNVWAFISSGLVVIITVLFVHMLNLGVQMMSTKRAGN